MPAACLQQTVPAPPGRIAELLRTALARGGWRIELINEDLCELAAQLHKSERVKGVQWNYEYRCVASWEPHDTSATVAIEVSEERNDWTRDQCQSKCVELMRAVIETAAKLEQAEQRKPKPNRYGAARWGTHDDLGKAGYLGGHEDHRRLLLSPGFDDNFATLTPEDTHKHALACGPTGSGKTTAVFIPNLIERLQSSAIVTEATAGSEPPDLYSKTAGYRFLAGNQHIYYFNPDDLRSDRINPIDAVTSYAKAQQLAQLVIENTTSKNNYGDDVWPKSEANLLAILIAHAAAERQHLGYIRALLRDGPDQLLSVLADSKVEQVREEYRGFCNNSRDGFKYGVFAGLMQRLGLWVNPRIVALTQTTDFDISSLRHQLFTFYLATPAQKTHLKPVAALIFNFILEQALESEFDHPLFLSLDEFTNFGLIPGIAEKLSIIRHKKIGVILGFQDYSQLLKVYGKEDAAQLFSQPGTKFFFRPRTLEVAEKISKMAGMTTVFERKMTSSGHIQERESGRPLVDPGEVLAMDDGAMLLFTPRCPPMQIPRFLWEDFATAGEIKALPKLEIQIDERLVQECESFKDRQDWQVAGEQALKQELPEFGGAPKQTRGRDRRTPKPPEDADAKNKRKKTAPPPDTREDDDDNDPDVSYH